MAGRATGRVAGKAIGKVIGKVIGRATGKAAKAGRPFAANARGASQQKMAQRLRLGAGGAPTSTRCSIHGERLSSSLPLPMAPGTVEVDIGFLTIAAPLQGMQRDFLFLEDAAVCNRLAGLCMNCFRTTVKGDIAA